MPSWLNKFIEIAPCDAAEPWQLGFQDAATPTMQGIIDLHHDIFFFLILILVFVSRILVRALWHFHWGRVKMTLISIGVYGDSFILLGNTLYILGILWSSRFDGSFDLVTQGLCNSGVGGVEAPPSPPVVGIPVAAEVEVLPAAPVEVPPAAPEIPLHPLMGDPQRQEELYNRFLLNTFGENPSLGRITDTVFTQSHVERLIEAALVHSGFNPGRIYQSRHRIRGILFYPRGRAMSVRQYRAFLREINRLGTRDTRPFQRVLRAIRDSDLWL